MWLNINGVNRMFMCDPLTESLADVLRRLGCTSVKVGCGIGVCGSCTVLLNGELVRSCTRKIGRIEEYSKVITVEGIGTPNHLHPIQVAFMNNGAIQCGFCTPGFVVSTYAMLTKNSNPTRQEVRDWFTQHKNVCRCTGYKQIVNAVMDAARVMRGECTVDDIKVKMPEDGEYYGKPLVRPTSLAKVCGLADYGDDQELKMPANAFHVAMVQPKLAHHAKILKIDISEAQKMPGVAKIILAKDLLDAGGSNIMAEANFHERSTVRVPARKVLADDIIYRYGDVVALAVADTKQHARAAAAKVKVDIEKLPAYMNFLEAAMPDAQRIHEHTPNIYCMQPVLKGEGLKEPRKVAEIIDKSAYSVEGSFYSSREPHLSIEGDAVQAYFDEDGFLTFQCKSQGVYSSITRIGKCLGVPTSKMRVIMNPTGASFGWSTHAGDLALAGAACVVMNAPVALSMSYEEHQHFSGKRCPCHSNGRLACDENGKITAAEFDFGLDHGAYSWGGDDCMTKQARFAFFPYCIPNVAGLCRVANTNHNFGTAYRSYGSPQAYTLGEALMDMLAEKAGIDPFEFRWRNIGRPGDTNINSYPFRQYPMEEMMKKMKPLYEAAVAEAKEKDTPEKRRGVGLAWGGFNVTEGGTDKAGAALEINPDGTFTKYDTYQELGQGGDIGSLMITLEVLKPLHVKPEQIRLVQNDTKLCPDSGMSGASRTHYMSGHASIVAAEKLLNAMRKPDGTYRTYEEMKAEGIETKVRGQWVATYCADHPVDQATSQGEPFSVYMYSIFMPEVAVDTTTGKVKVEKFTCVADVGTIMNRLLVEGNFYGGLVQGIGLALSENFEDIKHDTSLMACGIPYPNDAPDDIELHFNETYRPEGPYGAAGCGEAPLDAPHPAILNAIFNATGARVTRVPALPEVVLEALKKVQK